jgi:hypothetical protein
VRADRDRLKLVRVVLAHAHEILLITTRQRVFRGVAQDSAAHLEELGFLFLQVVANLLTQLLRLAEPGLALLVPDAEFLQQFLDLMMLRQRVA